MNRILYDTNTGAIISCRSIPDHMLDRNIAKRPNTAYINGYINDISTKKINLSDLSIVDKADDTDWNQYMRQHRNGRLKATDWTQVPDSPLTTAQKTAWQTYRQSLRDLPDTLGNISSQADIIWPDAPE